MKEIMDFIFEGNVFLIVYVWWVFDKLVGKLIVKRKIFFSCGCVFMVFLVFMNF